MKTDPNSLQTTHGYDTAARPSNTTAPTGAYLTTSYNDVQQQVSRTINHTEGTNRAVTAAETYNGWDEQPQAGGIFACTGARDSCLAGINETCGGLVSGCRRFS